MIKYIPNILTLLRLAATPVMIVAFLEGQFGLVLTIFIMASVTDGVDGFIARRYDARSELGAILDPIADKLMIQSIFYLLYDAALIPAWLWLLVLLRDFCIVSYSVAMHYLHSSVLIRPTYLSKFNTFLQFTFLTLVLAHLAQIGNLLPFAQNTEWLIAVTTVLSGAHYFWAWVLKPQSE